MLYCGVVGDTMANCDIGTLLESEDVLSALDTVVLFA